MAKRPPNDDPAPTAPIRPDVDDCCNSGCQCCVFDRYEEAMERYRAELKAWESRHAGRMKGSRRSVSR
ncbi:oxidoreductase-like domain-containing protein [Undibacterium arcticum]|uniref:Oxidoreductase-like domain-containing protein n=1 Tax=Undibacterium arcticum TaxID=1762892 RepID=A0ABV7F3B5_9BURK